MSEAPLEQDNVIEAPFSDALSERYLSYALSTIMARSLPDVRDGLKPVHRRLLYAMRLLKLDPKSGFKKCARVVGDVIGKYHPHGDQAVYDALVRLAQDFSVRYPLVDGQGNFGNVDGDNAAAMRYTEARLTEISHLMMDGLDEDAVDFRETYDGEDSEPIVFPAAFPNLLANGATGIAVGMATSIPPHNAGELVDALLHLIKHPNCSTETLVKYVPGPDFPTGGILVEPRESIIKSYDCGKGAFRLRARWEREDTGRGTYQIVVTEIPYQVQKSKLIEKIAELINDRKLPILSDIRDESSEDVRIVLEPKTRSVEPHILMESLFRLTDLETRISLNLNVLDSKRVPRVMKLREALQAFLDHRNEVLVRRTDHRLQKIAHRLEILRGYLVAYLNLDEIIRIIREDDHPKRELMNTFSLTDTQAEAILNMRLRSLRRLEEMEIRTEYENLKKEQSELLDLMGSRELQWQRIAADLREIRDTFGAKSEDGKRRTGFADAPVAEVVPLEAMIEKEPVTVICSEKGWIRAMKGHVDPSETLKFKEGDGEKFRFHALTTDKILIFATNGRFYTIGADKLPGGRGHGDPVRLMVDMDQGVEIVALCTFVAGSELFVAASNGKGFRVEADAVLAMTRTGKQIMNVKGDVMAKVCIPIGGDHVAVVGENRKLLIFPVDEVPVLARGAGVALQKYRDGGLSDVITFNLEDGLSWKMGGSGDRRRTETDLTAWLGKRAQAGRLPPTGFPKSNTFE